MSRSLDWCSFALANVGVFCTTPLGQHRTSSWMARNFPTCVTGRKDLFSQSNHRNRNGDGNTNGNAIFPPTTTTSTNWTHAKRFAASRHNPLATIGVVYSTFITLLLSLSLCVCVCLFAAFFVAPCFTLSLSLALRHAHKHTLALSLTLNASSLKDGSSLQKARKRVDGWFEHFGHEPHL